MKTPSLIMALLLSLSPLAMALELPLFGELPRLEKEWTVADSGFDDRTSIATSWIVFLHAETGDRLSLRVQRLGDRPYPKVELNGPFTEAAITHFPGGWAAQAQPDQPELKGSSWASARLELLPHETTAVESTTFWEEESGANQIAHGYFFTLDELGIYLQHTSNHVITPEEAQSLADALISVWMAREAPN